MGAPPVILHLLIVSCFLSIAFATSQNGTQMAAPTSTATNVAAEGGTIPLPPTDSTQNGHMIKVNHDQHAPNDSTHLGREHMLKVDHDQEATKFPPYEVGQKNDNKTSVPKKDAILHVSNSTSPNNTSLNNTSSNNTSPNNTIPNNTSPNNTSPNSTSTSSNTTSASLNQTKSSTTSTTPVPHKPTVTIGEDEEPPNSKAKLKLSDADKHGINIESVTEKTKKTDYVVPIVAVILSVPLVAIIFSVLYKRGADWWQHRHYRRMDFLIEGMYNN